MEDKRLWELAKKYGTPLYIFDADLIKKTYTMMKKELKDFEIFFLAHFIRQFYYFSI